MNFTFPDTMYIALLGGTLPETIIYKSAGSLMFDGVDDYIDCGQTDTLDAASGITVAAWVKTLCSFPTAPGTIVSNREGQYFDRGYELSLYNGAINWGVGTAVGTEHGFLSGWDFFDVQSRLDDGAWHFVVATHEHFETSGGVSRGYGQRRIYVDGVQTAGALFNNRRPGHGSHSFIIGSVSGSGDPYWNRTTLNIPFDFDTTDRSKYPKQITATSNPQLRRYIGDKVYGYAAAEFDGINDSLTIDPSPHWDLGNEDFTFETWFKIPSVPTTAGAMIIAGADFAIYSLNTHGIICKLKIDGKWDRYVATDRTGKGGGQYDDDIWHHLAFVRSSGVLRLFIDGIQKDYYNISGYTSRTWNGSYWTASPYTLLYTSAIWGREHEDSTKWTTTNVSGPALGGGIVTAEINNDSMSAAALDMSKGLNSTVALNLVNGQDFRKLSIWKHADSARFKYLAKRKTSEWTAADLVKDYTSQLWGASYWSGDAVTTSSEVNDGDTDTVAGNLGKTDFSWGNRNNMAAFKFSHTEGSAINFQKVTLTHEGPQYEKPRYDQRHWSVSDGSRQWVSLTTDKRPINFVYPGWPNSSQNASHNIDVYGNFKYLHDGNYINNVVRMFPFYSPDTTYYNANDYHSSLGLADSYSTRIEGVDIYYRHTDHSPYQGAGQSNDWGFMGVWFEISYDGKTWYRTGSSPSTITIGSRHSGSPYGKVTVTVTKWENAKFLRLKSIKYPHESRNGKDWWLHDQSQWSRNYGCWITDIHLKISTHSTRQHGAAVQGDPENKFNQAPNAALINDGTPDNARIGLGVRSYNGAYESDNWNPAYIILDTQASGYQSAKEFTQLALNYVCTDNGAKIKVQYSDNKTSWLDAHTISLNHSTSMNTTHTWDWPSKGVYRYWRILWDGLRANNAGDNTFFGEVQFGALKATTGDNYAIKIEYSDDDSTWYDVYGYGESSSSYSYVTVPGNQGPHDFTWDHADEHRYWRILYYGDSGQVPWNSNWWTVLDITEVQFHSILNENGATGFNPMYLNDGYSTQESWGGVDLFGKSSDAGNPPWVKMDLNDKDQTGGTYPLINGVKIWRDSHATFNPKIKIEYRARKWETAWEGEMGTGDTTISNGEEASLFEASWEGKIATRGQWRITNNLPSTTPCKFHEIQFLTQGDGGGAYKVTPEFSSNGTDWHPAGEELTIDSWTNQVNLDNRDGRFEVALDTSGDKHWNLVKALVQQDQDSTLHTNDHTGRHSIDVPVSSPIVQSTDDPWTNTSQVIYFNHGVEYAHNNKSIELNNNEEDFNFEADDFTIECWVRFKSLPRSEGPPSYIFVHRSPGSSNSEPSLSIWATGWSKQAGFNTDKHLGINFTVTSEKDHKFHIATESEVEINRWYHLALVRDGSQLNAFMDGVSIGELIGLIKENDYEYEDSIADRKLKPFTDPPRLGASIATTHSVQRAFGLLGQITTYSPFDGELFEFRATKGMCRYATESVLAAATLKISSYYDIYWLRYGYDTYLTVTLQATDSTIVEFVEGTDWIADGNNGNDNTTAASLAAAINNHPKFTATSSGNNVNVNQAEAGVEGNTVISMNYKWWGLDITSKTPAGEEGFSGGKRAMALPEQKAGKRFGGKAGATYKYWRIKNTEATDSASDIGEIQFFGSTESGAIDVNRDNINNGNLTDTAADISTYSSTSPWVQFDAGSGQTSEFTQIKVTKQITTTDNPLISIQYSSDADTWSTIITTHAGLGPTFSHGWTSVGSYRYWRIISADSTNQPIKIYEIQWYEDAGLSTKVDYTGGKNLYIGKDANDGDHATIGYLKGSLDNMRITNGVARYTGAFELSAISPNQTWAYRPDLSGNTYRFPTPTEEEIFNDPYYDYVVCWLQSEYDEGNYFRDLCRYNWNVHGSHWHGISHQGDPDGGYTHLSSPHIGHAKGRRLTQSSTVRSLPWQDNSIHIPNSPPQPNDIKWYVDKLSDGATDDFIRAPMPDYNYHMLVTTNPVYQSARENFERDNAERLKEERAAMHKVYCPDKPSTYLRDNPALPQLAGLGKDDWTVEMWVNFEHFGLAGQGDEGRGGGKSSDPDDHVLFMLTGNPGRANTEDDMGYFGIRYWPDADHRFGQTGPFWFIVGGPHKPGGQWNNGTRAYTCDLLIPSGLSTNVWYHVVCQKHNNVVACYLDGVRHSGQYDNYEWGWETVGYLRPEPYRGFMFGNGGESDLISPYKSSWTAAQPNSTHAHRRFCGYMDDIRITKGIARYKNQNFEKPVRRLGHSTIMVPEDTYVQGQSGCKSFEGKIDQVAVWDHALTPGSVLALYNGQKDANWDKTVLLLPSDCFNNTTRFFDKSLRRQPVSAVGNMKHSTGIDAVTANKWVGRDTAMYFDGESNLTLPHVQDFKFNSNEFTIDFWMYPLQQTGDGTDHGEVSNSVPLFEQYKAGDHSSLRIGLRNDNLIDVKAWTSSNTNGLFEFKSTEPVQRNKWNHVAVTRDNLATITNPKYNKGWFSFRPDILTLSPVNDGYTSINENTQHGGAYKMDGTRGIRAFIGLDVSKATDGVQSSAMFHKVVMHCYKETGTTYSGQAGRDGDQKDWAVWYSDDKQNWTRVARLYIGKPDTWGEYDYWTGEYKISRRVVSWDHGDVGSHRYWKIERDWDPPSGDVTPMGWVTEVQWEEVQTGTWSVYVSSHGVSKSTSVSPYPSDLPINIGYGTHDQYNSYYNGFMEDIRIINGAAEPPTDHYDKLHEPVDKRRGTYGRGIDLTEDLTNDSKWSGDPTYDQQATYMLIPSNHPHRHESFFDASDANQSITNVTVGNYSVYHSASGAKFGHSSIYFTGDTAAEDVALGLSNTGYSTDGGVGPHLEIPHNPVLDFGKYSLSIDCWIKCAPQNFYKVAGGGLVMFKGDKYNNNNKAWAVRVQAYTGVLSFDWFSGAGGGSISHHIRVDDNTWHHIAITYDYWNESYTLFVDGVPTTTGMTGLFYAGTKINTPNPIMIGAGRDFYSGGVNYPFKGYMDDLRITAGGRFFNHFTPPTKAARGNYKDKSDLISWWQLNEANGVFALDEKSTHEGRLREFRTDDQDATQNTFWKNDSL